MSDPSLLRFRAVLAGALAHLDARRQEINDLNVFPVADGDTGDNMTLTLRAVLEEIDRLAADSADRSLDEVGRDEIVQSVTRAALLGARGNSGVILSQLIRGAAEELVSRPGELVDPVLVAAAMTRAADRAYASVREPQEGTILTVAREMGVAAASAAAHTPRLDPGADPAAQAASLAALLDTMLAAGEASVRRGPELLPVLKEAGVVDSGGHALTVIFAGVIAVLRGGDAPEVAHFAPARVTHPHHESSSYRYCTNFAVFGRDLDPSAHTAALEAIGDSVLVVGDASTLKVHVHTDAPEQAAAVFDGVGEVGHLDVADMRVQVAERSGRLAAGRSAVVSVVAGEGLERLFASLGADCLDGGATLNPSTYELLAAIHQAPGEEIVLLPNSGNVIMAAEEAAALAQKRVAVVPTRSQQAGLSVLLGFEADRSADENAAAMAELLAGVRTGGVAPAGRDDAQGRFRAGDAVGYVADELVAWGDPGPTLAAVVGRLADGAELLTAIVGDGAPLATDDVLALVADEIELELHEGGQPSWWWLLAAE